MEIYDAPAFSVHSGACADSVYQALFSGLGTRLIAYTYDLPEHLQCLLLLEPALLQ